MIERISLDSGSTDFGFVDLKGRACGYAWEITQIIYDRPMSYGDGRRYEAGETILQMETGPTRNGHHYGPAHYVRLDTLEEARQIVVRRVEASRKRDAKKFVKAA